MTDFKLTPETTGYDLYCYARDALKGPLPEGPLLDAFVERANGWDLYMYARYVLKDPLPEGPLLDAFIERADGRELYWYARDVLKGPLPEGPLLEAFRERAYEEDLRWYTRRFGPLLPKDPPGEAMNKKSSREVAEMFEAELCDIYGHNVIIGYGDGPIVVTAYSDKSMFTIGVYNEIVRCFVHIFEMDWVSFDYGNADDMLKEVSKFTSNRVEDL